VRWRLCRCGNAADFRPNLESLHSGNSVFGGSDVIATEVEEVADLVVGGKETLCLAG
jgi:hypothetical protein